MNLEEFLKAIKGRNIIIFGAGFVAELFWQGLKRHGLADRVRCCVVSQTIPGRQFHGFPVYSLPDGLPASGNDIICMAVHGSVLKEVEEQHPELKEQALWINPFLIDLLYGEPLRQENVSVRDIIAMQDPDMHWLSVRYAAARDHMEKSPHLEETKELYIKAISLHCTGKTAAQRELQLEKLVESMAQVGFGPGYPPVRLDENLRIIDGLHRIACAVLFRLPAVPAALYSGSDIYDRLLSEKNRLPESFLRQSGFSESEIDFLRNANTELFGKASRL